MVFRFIRKLFSTLRAPARGFTMLTFTVITLALVPCITGERIPYSYASGRDMAAVERRYQAFHEAKARNADFSELNEICGPVPLQANCAIAGRPSDAASTFCDTMCCLNGNKAGNCGGVKLSIRPDWGKMIAGIVAGSSGGPQGAALGALAGITPSLAAGCSCSDDERDVKCGPDGSFLKIRCPVDNSACWRKCCREGRSGGRCRGFLRLSCRCD